MTIAHIVRAGAYAVLVPLVGATGTWTEAMSAAPFVNLQAPSTSDLPVRSTHLEKRDASHGLQPAVDGVLHADRGPAWLAWRVPAMARSGDRGNWNDGEGRCVLDDDGDFRGDHGIQGNLEDLVILVRTTAAALDRLTFSDARCTVDAGARTVYWLDGVVPAESVKLIAGLVSNRARLDGGDNDHGDRHRDPAQRGIAAIALHRDAAADAALGQFVQPSSPKWLRRDAAFWLGAARGESGAAIVTKLARTDADDSFREHLTFVLTLTGESGIPTLIDLAKHDESAGVRGQALFWLAQKAGQRAIATLGQAVTDDPNSEVRKRAVFAISQLPKDDAVPKLIELAKTHRDPEVRKQAMFWLGQTGDPRAIAFFESVLKP
jgi:HEAT repeat protein